MYAARRISGLGDALKSSYFLKRLLDDYLDEHPDRDAEWDIVRDDRGTFHEPHTGREVRLGTIDVREYLENLHTDHADHLDGLNSVPQLSLYVDTVGPLDAFGTVLYIEKEGFLGAMRYAQIPERYDLGIASCKGYSVKAARLLMRRFADDGVRVLVARDFDKAGFGIYDTLGKGSRISVSDSMTSGRWTWDRSRSPTTTIRGRTSDSGVRRARRSRTCAGPMSRRSTVGASNSTRSSVVSSPTGSRPSSMSPASPRSCPTRTCSSRRTSVRGRRLSVNAAVEQAARTAEHEEIEVPGDILTRITTALEGSGLPWDTVVAEIVQEDRERL